MLGFITDLPLSEYYTFVIFRALLLGQQLQVLDSAICSKSEQIEVKTADCLCEITVETDHKVEV